MFMVLKHDLRRLFRGNNRLMKIVDVLEDFDNNGGTGTGTKDYFHR